MSDSTGTEGGSASFEVSLSKPSSKTVSVTASTSSSGIRQDVRRLHVTIRGDHLRARRDEQAIRRCSYRRPGEGNG